MAELKKVAGEIFSQLKKTKSILCPLHLHPDGDAIAAALVVRYLLMKMRKRARVTSTDELPKSFVFLKDFQKIEIKDFAELDLSQFDLLLFLDISSLSRFTKREDFKIPKGVFTINIDHHPTNTRFANINAVLSDIGSTCQILYEFCKFQNIKIDKNLANWLYCGIYTDTGGFEYAAPARTHQVAADLLMKGANHNEIVFQIKRKKDLPFLKSWGRILENLKVDKEHHFCWSTISHQDILHIGCVPTDYYGATEYIKNVEETDFGIILAEEKPNEIRGHLRSRRQPEEGGFDVSQVAIALGGGGHKAAAGFSLEMNLAKAEKKTLEIARRFAKKHDQA